MPAGATTGRTNGARRRPLDRVRIVTAAARLIEREGADALTMRRLGTVLRVDPTAVYRHFRDKDELLRAVGDHLHGQVLVDLPADDGDWRAVVREVCIRLRASHLARPHLAALVRTGPPLQLHEFRLTELLLRQLRRGGLDDDATVQGYHALIELTVGAAAIDAAMAAEPARTRQAAYAAWRNAYADLDEAEFSESVRLAALLYPGTADGRFAFALDRLLDGLAALAPTVRATVVRGRGRRDPSDPRR